MEKILTVSIAAYNVEKYIRKALDSLIIKNMDKLEVLIIVDGGNDKTLEIAKEYEEKYPNTFRAIYKENGGYGSTINKGIELAKGKYFKQLDGDDWFDTENLDIICQTLSDDNIDADVIYTPYIKFNEKDSKESIIRNEIEKVLKEEKLENAIKNANKQLVMHSLMYKTENLRKNNINIDEHCFYTDTEYAIFPLYYSKKIKVFDIPLYVYRIGIEGQSISIESRRKHYAEHEKVSKNLVEKYKQCNDCLTPNLKKYIEYYMRTCLAASITNFLVILKPNKEIFLHIKEFDRDIFKFNKDIYKEMEKNSKVIKLLRTNNYYIYILCHFIRIFKMKHSF